MKNPYEHSTSIMLSPSCLACAWLKGVRDTEQFMRAQTTRPWIAAKMPSGLVTVLERLGKAFREANKPGSYPSDFLK